MSLLLHADIKSFINNLRIYPRDVLFDVFVRYALSPMVKVVKRWDTLPSWSTLLKELLKEQSFLLVVLDSCRYDFFRLVYRKYFYGKLMATRSLGTNTYGWLPNIFSYTEFRDVRIFYAGLAIKTHDIKLNEFISHSRDIEIIRIEPCREKDMGTVLPWEVNEVVLRKKLSKRNIVWYMQPHYPWIGYRDLSLKLLNEVTWHDFTPKDLVREGIKHKGISRHDIIKAYLDNLRKALKATSTLVREIRDRFTGKIVITSDHGELLGEYGLYLHPHYELPQLCIVPWLEVEGII